MIDLSNFGKTIQQENFDPERNVIYRKRLIISYHFGRLVADSVAFPIYLMLLPDLFRFLSLTVRLADKWKKPAPLPDCGACGVSSRYHRLIRSAVRRGNEAIDFAVFAEHLPITPL